LFLPGIKLGLLWMIRRSWLTIWAQSLGFKLVNLMKALLEEINKSNLKPNSTFFKLIVSYTPPTFQTNDVHVSMWVSFSVRKYVNVVSGMSRVSWTEAHYTIISIAQNFNNSNPKPNPTFFKLIVSYIVKTLKIKYRARHSYNTDVSGYIQSLPFS